MARSFRHSPFGGTTTAASEKHDKQLANRRLRRRVRDALLLNEEALPLLREVSNVWRFAKDGKCFYGWSPKLLRK